MRHRAFASFVVLAAAAAATADITTTPIPVPARGLDIFTSEIDLPDEVDPYAIFLAAGDSISVTMKAARPSLGLAGTLSLTAPDGSDAGPVVTRQDTPKAALKFTATTTGVHVLRITGRTGGFAGSTGNYVLTIAVKRAKVAPSTFADVAGGPISVFFTTPAGSTLTLSAKTKKGGFDLTELLRPDGTPEPGFAAAQRKKGRVAATLSKFPLTGGAGRYEVRGAFDAGSKVSVSARPASGEKKTSRRLPAEPRFDPAYTPFPSAGIAGTVMNLVTLNFDDLPIVDDDNQLIGHAYPSFRLGGIDIPASSVQHPNGQIFTFPVPAGLAVGQSYDLEVRNADGQGTTLIDAFFMVPAPQALGLSPTVAGPAGGRHLRITGLELRRNSSVDFDGTIVQPEFTRPPTYIDVVAPPHAPGTATLTVRDEFGQTTIVPVTLTYLDIGSNRITSISPASIQAVGGETITVNGADFGPDTVLTYDGATTATTQVSPSVLQFVAPEHVAGTVKLRVTDQYDQTSAIDVQVRGYTDTTASAIPAPDSTPGAIDGWRATRVLAGDLDGDGKKDLVLLRPSIAFGNDANRSRVRLLLGDGAGAFHDVTAAKFPGLFGDDDWRARDGVLADLDGDSDLDLAIITDSPIAGGTRSGLRVLTNDSHAVFTDVTSTAVPALTSYGDVNQGVAIAAANVDGATGVDLVILHTNFFTETIVTSGGTPMPPDPPPPDIVTTNHFGGLRILTNNGAGVFSRKANALPAFTPASRTQYQGNALAVGDVNGNGRQDIVLTRASVVVDSQDPNNFLLTATLLANNGSGVYTDVSAAQLPAKSDPEYLQGDRLYLTDLNGDQKLDLAVVSATRLVSPVSTQVSTAPATRWFFNNGSGTLSPMSPGTLPATEGDDSLQADALAIGDFTGDGKTDVFVVSSHAPNIGDRGGRLLVKFGSVWENRSKAIPLPSLGDDFRGADAITFDVDADGDLDIVVVRDEAIDTSRNTLVLRNDR